MGDGLHRHVPCVLLETGLQLLRHHHIQNSHPQDTSEHRGVISRVETTNSESDVMFVHKDTRSFDNLKRMSLCSLRGVSLLNPGPRT
jgi:hypothetical protein